MADETQSLSDIQNAMDAKLLPEAPQEEATEETEVSAGPEVSEQTEQTDEVEATEETEQKEEFKTITVEDEEYSVPVGSKLEEHLLRQADYTQKTQGVANDRKDIDAQLKQIHITQQEQKFAQDSAPDVQEIGLLNAEIQRITQDLSSNASNLTAEDMFRQKILLDGYKDQKAEKENALNDKWQQHQETLEQSRTELLEAGNDALVRHIPNWGKDEQEAVFDFAHKTLGFTQAELNHIYDPKHVRTLWMAKQYANLDVTGAVKKVEAAPAISPKARGKAMPEDVKRKLTLRKKLKSSTSDRDKARLIQEEMAARVG